MSEPRQPVSEIDGENAGALDAAAERLSALLDGELDGAQVAAACAQWRADPQARARWHGYGLIGDTLRSDELANPSRAGDAAFLGALRERLAREPVPLERAASERATASAAAVSTPFLRRWTTPVGVAAGLLLVAALAWTLNPSGSSGGSPAELAAATASAQPQVVALDSPTVNRASTEPADAELQPYLHVHRFYAGKASAGPMPNGLRGASHTPGAR